MQQTRGLLAVIQNFTDGFGIDINTGEHMTSGWVVAPNKLTEFRVAPEDLTESVIDAYVETFKDLLAEGEYLGGWFNSEDDRFYLDVVDVFDDAREAIKAARDGQQIGLLHLDSTTYHDTQQYLEELGVPREEAAGPGLGAVQEKYNRVLTGARILRSEQGSDRIESYYLEEEAGGGSQDGGEVALQSRRRRQESCEASRSRYGIRTRKGHLRSVCSRTGTIVPVPQFKAEDILQFIYDNFDLLNEPGRFLGAWVDNGNVYLDVSNVVDTLEEAIPLAEAAQQLAVFDLGAFEEIRFTYENNRIISSQRIKAGDGGTTETGGDEGTVRDEGPGGDQGEGSGAAGGWLRSERRSGGLPGGGVSSSAERVDAGIRRALPQSFPARPNAERNDFIRAGVREYNRRYGLGESIEGHYAPVDEARARRIAAAYDALPVFDESPEVLAAYRQLEKEIQQLMRWPPLLMTVNRKVFG